MTGLELSTTMKEVHKLPYLIVVELHLPFLLASGAGTAGGGSSGVSHLSVIILRVVYVWLWGSAMDAKLAQRYLVPP